MWATCIPSEKVSGVSEARNAYGGNVLLNSSWSRSCFPTWMICKQKRVKKAFLIPSHGLKGARASLGGLFPMGFSSYSTPGSIINPLPTMPATIPLYPRRDWGEASVFYFVLEIELMLSCR